MSREDVVRQAANVGIIVALFAACDSRDAPAPPEMIPDPARVGLPLAEVPAADRSRWLGSGDWALEPVSSFAATMDDTVLVHTINALRPGPDGLLYVVMQRQASISVLDPDGTLVRRVGQWGSGPGEFQAVSSHGWRNDSLWVLDTTLGRISWIDLTGNFLGSQSHGERTLRPTSVGTYIGLPLRDWNATELSLLLQTPGSDDPRVLHRSRWSRGGFRVPQGQGLRIGSHPQADAPLFAFHPNGDGVAVIDQSPEGGAIRIHWYGANGDRRYAANHELPTAPITPSDWEGFLDRWNNTPGSPPLPLPELLRAIPRPTTWPPVTRAIFASDSRLLVRGPETSADHVTWTLISPAGRMLGASTLPADLRVMYVSGDTLWGVRPNKVDLDVVTRYRIRW